MRAILSIILFSCVFTLNAQKNVFLDRAFWNEKTSINDVKEAVKEGNSPTEFNKYNFDATVYAILQNAPTKTIAYLLSLEGNEVSKITHDGRNYLMWAAYKHNYPVVKLLLEKGSDINIYDDKGQNTQTFAAMGGNLNIDIYTLLEENGLPIKTPSRKGETAMHLLSQHIEDIEQLNFFLEHGLSLKQTDKAGNNLFHFASAQGNIKVLNQLIEKDFDPKAKNKNGENALFFAARGKRSHVNEFQLFRFLHTQGLKLDLINNSGSTVLHYLARSQKDETVFKYFMEFGADVNKVNVEGNTALMIAMARNNTPAIEILFEVTEKKNIINKDGYSILTYALRTKNEKIISKLMEQNVNYHLEDKKGNNFNTHLVDTYKKEDKVFFEKYMKLFISKDVEIQAQTLQIATSKENEYLINFLTEKGADINAKNKEGLTALQLAAMKGENTEFIKFLIAKGADKDVQTEFGETVYELAKNNELLEGRLKFLK